MTKQRKKKPVWSDLKRHLADLDQPALTRMLNKRQRGYRNMGYEVKSVERVIE